MLIHLDLQERSYDIVVERGSLKLVSNYFSLDRKVMIVTDSGVPKEYAESVAAKCGEPSIVTIPEGEDSKNFDNYKLILKEMLCRGFTRSDCVVAIGGGVVGDLAGFVASSYMRGVDFYNIPTTLLSQIDSSIGGKVAIDFEGVKNIVGAFYQPKMVVIDPDTLNTLPKRQLSNGLAEAIKMALTSDPKLFELIKESDLDNSLDKNIDEIIVRSLNIKKSVVEQDEKEKGLRKILNFGHTIGHGIEATSNGSLYHGECVALGMIPMCSDDVRKELLYVLKKVGLPTETKFSKEGVYKALIHDKKFDGDTITLVKVLSIGSFEMIKASSEDLLKLLNKIEEEL